MKKTLLPLLCFAALAACTKSEVQYEAPGAITFSPVSQLSTKSVVDGNDFLILNMYVFANAGAADADAETFSDTYFANALFANKSNGVFAGSPNPYYWPNVKELIFSGVSASGNVNTNGGSTPKYALDDTDKKWKITLEDYAPGVGTATPGDNDLMWFPTTVSYGKVDVMGTGNDGDIDVVMQHACSWITINVKGDSITGKADDTSTTEINETTTWKVKSLVINDLSLSGTAVLGETATWSDLATDTGTFKVFDSNDGTVLTTSYVAMENVAKNTIVIPQTPTTLTVVYEYVSQKGAGDDREDIVIEETKTVNLTLDNTVTGENDSKGGNWLPGVHYTYNITIGTLEILIEPTATDWVEQEVTPEITL